MKTLFLLAMMQSALAFETSVRYNKDDLNLYGELALETSPLTLVKKEYHNVYYVYDGKNERGKDKYTGYWGTTLTTSVKSENRATFRLGSNIVVYNMLLGAASIGISKSHVEATVEMPIRYGMDLFFKIARHDAEVELFVETKNKSIALSDIQKVAIDTLTLGVHVPIAEIDENVDVVIRPQLEYSKVSEYDITNIGGSIGVNLNFWY